MTNKILNYCLHTIDLENNKLEKKDIPKNFNIYLDTLVDYLDNKQSFKIYTEYENSVSLVIDNIKNILIDRDNITYIDKLQHEISDHLFNTEIQAQDKIKNKDKKISNSNLIQLIKQLDNNIYIYMLVKIDLDDFYDTDTLNETNGFPSKIKNGNIGKSCLIFLEKIDNNIDIKSIKVYNQYNSKYWADFLNIKQNLKDDKITKHCFEEITKLINRNISKQSRSDSFYLKQLLISIFKTNEFIDYEVDILSILEKYIPNNKNIDYKIFLNNVCNLKNNTDFNTYFKVDNSKIEDKLKQIINVNQDIELLCSPNFRLEDVNLVSDDDEGTYLKIFLHNDKYIQEISDLIEIQKTLPIT